jgi:hypothetical protein
MADRKWTDPSVPTASAIGTSDVFYGLQDGVEKKYPSAIVRAASKGDTGDPGVDGRGLQSLDVWYALGTDTVTIPTQWQQTLPIITPGDYMWTRTRVIYTDSTTSQPFYTIARNGIDGDVRNFVTDPIETNEIEDAAVTAAKLATNSVATSSIQDGSVTTAKMPDSVITTPKIKDNMVTEAKMDSDYANSLMKKTGGTFTGTIQIPPKTADADLRSTEVASEYQVRKLQNLVGRSEPYSGGTSAFSFIDLSKVAVLQLAVFKGYFEIDGWKYFVNGAWMNGQLSATSYVFRIQELKTSHSLVYGTDYWFGANRDTDLLYIAKPGSSTSLDITFTPADLLSGDMYLWVGATSAVATIVQQTIIPSTKSVAGVSPNTQTNDIPAASLAAALKPTYDTYYQPQITTTGATNILLAPAASGGNPTGKALNTLLAAPTDVTANKLLVQPTTQGAAPGSKPFTDFMASPLAQTANTQLLVAPATLGAAPTLLPVADFGREYKISSLNQGYYTINSRGHKTIYIQSFEGGQGTNRRFMRLGKVNSDAYYRARFRVTSRYVYSTEDLIIDQQAANSSITKKTGACVKEAAVTEFALGLGQDGYVWLVFTTTDLGGVKMILDCTFPDPDKTEVIYQSAVISVYGSLVAW